jgi:hypothetical protein
MISVCKDVKEEILRVFGKDVGRELIQKVEASEFNLGRQSAERIIMAILFGSSGDKNKFRELINTTKTDWRDMLVGTGMANDDWRDVLKKNGYWVPPKSN